MARGEALSEPQHKVVTMDRKEKAVGQGEQHSRPQVQVECDPLAILEKGAVCIHLPALQQPAFSTGPLCWALRKSLGHCQSPPARLSAHEDMG